MRASLLLVSACLGAGCFGQITGDDSPPPAVDPTEPRNLCEGSAADIPGPRLLRRLTGPELTISIRDVFGFGDADFRGANLPADAAGRNGFTNNADRLAVNDTYAEALQVTAKKIGELVSAQPHLARILPCSGGGGQACAETYLDTIGRRMYRRPLTAEERARFLELYQTVTADSGAFATWVRWATVALVQSPNFVYRAELGQPSGAEYHLDGYEVATALAYNLTGRPPSDPLLDLASRGGLDSPDEIQEAARDLVVDPATGQIRQDVRDVFLRFTDQWLGLSSLANLAKDAASFPTFTTEIRQGLERETDAFISHVVFEQKGGIADLLTSPVTVIDGNLAAFYGFGPAGQAASSVVERPEGWGVGLLAQGSLLAINAGNVSTSPVLRGKLIRERFLCYDMPPPPPTAGPIPQPTGGETTRQRYDVLLTNKSCAGCHSLLNPLGYAFEHLDPAGRFRATENNFEIDDRGYIAGLGDTDIPFRGPVELASILAERPETSSCVASFMASYAYGLDHHDTTCLVTDLTRRFQAGEVSLLDFYIDLATTNHFTRRTDL